MNDPHWITFLERSTIQPGMRVLDVGANVGQFSAAFVRAGATVVAIEPDQRSCAALVATCPTVKVLPGAVSDRTACHVDFWLRQADSKHHSLYRQAVPHHQFAQLTTVDTITLDDLGRSFDFVKVDAQGAEGPILSGASQLLASDAAWLIELWPHGLSCAGWTVDRLIALVLDFTPYILDGNEQLQALTWDDIRTGAAELNPSTAVNVGIAKAGTPIGAQWARLAERKQAA